MVENYPLIETRGNDRYFLGHKILDELLLEGTRRGALVDYLYWISGWYEGYAESFVQTKIIGLTGRETLIRVPRLKPTKVMIE